MTAAVISGGLGFDTAHAAAIYGWYTFSVYALAIPGGWVADRFLGQYRSVLMGGIIIALGQFSLALAPLPFFYGGLILIACGTGLLKPNVSTMVGSLYEEQDARRDAGFSIFYMGINVGAMISPLVAGTLGQRVSWHLGFAVGGVGMTIGLIQYTLGKRRLMPALQRLEARPDRAKAGVGRAGGFSAEEWKRIAAIGVFFIFSMLFWAAFEQAGSSLNLFADRYTRLSVFGFSFPSTWFQSLNSFFMVFGLAIFFSWLWVRLGPHEPSSPAKFAYGLFFVGLGFLLLVPAAIIAQSGGRTVLVSPMWLTGVYFLHTVGELCLSPVGLSLMTKLAPQRIVGLMMGVWFLSTATGNKMGGWVAGFFDTLPLPMLFAAVAGTTIGSAVLLVLLIRSVRKLMGGVH
jgi:POT family proton-dependent oligopeptide transporter